MILPDTSVWIDHFRGVTADHTALLHRALRAEIVMTGDLILAELMQGFRTRRDIEKAKALMTRLHYADMLGRDIALRAAENYRYLRRKGITPRKTIDALIATFCIENNVFLLHNDRDFDPFVELLGLKVIGEKDIENT